VLEDFSSAEGPTATNVPLTGSNTGFLRPQSLSVDPSTQALIVPDEGESAIYFFDDTSDLTGNKFPSRILQGPATQFSAPVHAVVDSATNELYVLDRGTNRILVFQDASTIEGDLAPNRIIGGATSAFQNASTLLLIPSSNRLTVISPSEIFTFENMDTLTGDPAPIGRVTGPATTFQNLSYGRLTSEGTLILTDQGTNSILFFENFQFDRNDVAPTRTVSGPNTGIQSPTQFALSGAEIYLANGLNILVFNDLDTLEGNPFPTRRIEPTNPAATTVRGLVL
jgi:DNA-binding beta-propeller fold protein YncE